MLQVCGDVLGPFGADLDSGIIPDPEAPLLKPLNDGQDGIRVLMGVADENIRLLAFVCIWHKHGMTSWHYYAYSTMFSP